ncbi:MAG: alginate O-acetyltransferase [Rhodocyclales bacterium]|nr:alginate O-acetyltransferase [Rhodocyclales bacterium]
MIFTSLEFLIFFPIVVAIYFLLPNRFRWAHLLLASYYFYMAWKPVYALLLLFSTVSFYLAALGVDRYQDERKRAGIFWLGISLNLGMLFTFKYYNFFEAQARALAESRGWHIHIAPLDVLLPMGISFFTFQGISYLVDVYRRDMPAERHLGLLMLYKAFFPQLVAGPIERGTHFLPQLRKNLLVCNNSQRIRFEYERVVSGLRLMLLGFFKKIVLADNLSLIVQPVYAAPNEYSGISALVATVAFAFQIFFDFSAYTDIARGISRVLGFELIENFKHPYFATSVPEFWQRWHISLSSWFRDYVYIPLGGNRVVRSRWFLNLWIVFLLCGLWHGANWTFIAWGAMHGFYYFLTYIFTPPARWFVAHTFLSRFPALCRLLLVMLTFSLVCWAWVMFRAENLTLAFAIWINIAHIPVDIFEYFNLVVREGVHFAPLKAFGLGWLTEPAEKLSLMPAYVFGLTVIYLVISHEMREQDDGEIFSTWSTPLRWLLYVFSLTSILLLGRFEAAQFIYFQF